MSADPALDQSALTEPEAPDPGVVLGKWNALVRRARIGRERKAVALTVSSYANKVGTDIHCGVATLAVDCEIGYSTARRYLAWLREVGLIELVRHGNPRKGLSDEYRLIVGPAAYERLEIPADDEYKALKDGLREANRAGQKARRLRDQRSPMSSADSTDGEAPKRPPGNESALTMSSAENADQRSLGAQSALTLDERPPSLHTFPQEHTSGGAPPPDPRRPKAPPSSGPWDESRNLINKGETKPPQNRTTTSAARGTAPVDNPTRASAEIKSSERKPRRDRREGPGPCRHGNNSRANRKGQPRCDQCREEPQQDAQVIPFPLASGGSP